MTDDKIRNKDIYISDDGVIKTNKTKQTNFFVALCRILTIIMAILGIAAFISGNF